MDGYIFEKSNANHPGITILKNGSQVFPTGKFVDVCNNALDLVDTNSEFYSLMSTGAPDIDELNKMVRTNNKYISQHGESLLFNLRNKNEAVYIPDSEYYMREFNYIKNLRPNSIERETRTKRLYTEFSRTMAFCVQKNNENARRLGLTIPENAK